MNKLKPIYPPHVFGPLRPRPVKPIRPRPFGPLRPINPLRPVVKPVIFRVITLKGKL